MEYVGSSKLYRFMYKKAQLLSLFEPCSAALSRLLLQRCPGHAGAVRYRN